MPGRSSSVMRKIIRNNLYVESVEFHKGNLNLKNFEFKIKNMIDKINDDGYAFHFLSKETYFDNIKINVYFIPINMFVLFEKQENKTEYDLKININESMEWLIETSFNFSE